MKLLKLCMISRQSIASKKFTVKRILLRRESFGTKIEKGKKTAVHGVEDAWAAFQVRGDRPGQTGTVSAAGCRES
ncbi:hypothetical protein [Geomonas terrae]|uniref:hypothetical protein n=1 Tax=Geomonas terrae TaxID=2562681 RepID=UPI0013A5C718|nr:hypothetical protein [Geomonas terrae]